MNHQKDGTKKIYLLLIVLFILLSGCKPDIQQLTQDQDIQGLINALKNKDFQADAVNALVQIGEPAIEPLINNLSSSNVLKREGVIEALVRIGDTDPTPIVTQIINKMTNETIWSVVGIEAVLSRLGESAVEPCIFTLTQTASEKKQASAVRALGMTGSSQALDPLVQQLGCVYQDIREEAIQAIIKIVEGDSTRLADYLLQQETVKIYEVLIRLGDSRMIDEMIVALNQFGDKYMALDYLNCGEKRLESAATTWAHKNGYIVYSTMGGGSITWGSE